MAGLRIMESTAQEISGVLNLLHTILVHLLVERHEVS